MVDAAVADVGPDKRIAWRAHRFDVLFKGDDWQGTDRGRQLQAKLADVGATMCFFPYTRHTSSTMLRSVLTALAKTPVHLLPDDACESVQNTCPLCGGPRPAALRREPEILSRGAR